MMKDLKVHLQAYLFIRKNRFQRKKRTYSLALQVMIDRTTAIYLGVLFIYLILSFFLVSDIVQVYEPYLLQADEWAQAIIPYLLPLLPILYVLRSFKNPGITFSSAEQKLVMLPFSKKKIWVLAFLDKGISLWVMMSIIGIPIVWLTPFSWTTFFLYFAVLVGAHLLLVLPQWRLFQKSIWVKIIFLLLSITMNGLISFFPKAAFIMISLYVLSLVVINLLILRTTWIQAVKWEQVIAWGDFNVWNMPLISRISQVEMKKPKGISIFQRFVWRRKPFTYKHQPVYHRLWQLYFGKNFALILQGVGSILVLLFVFSFLNEIYFHIILVVAFYIYTMIAKSFFLSRFTFDIVQYLPWDLVGYKRSFLKWALFTSFVFLLPIGLFLFMNLTVWFPLQLLYFIGTWVSLLFVQMDEAIATLTKEPRAFNWPREISYLALLGIVVSLFFPYLLWLSLLFPIYFWRGKVW